MKTYIVNQKILADQIGCSEKHLSNIKRRISRTSPELADRFESITGISAMTLVAASKPTLKKRLREYFESQKIAMISGRNN